MNKLQSNGYQNWNIINPEGEEIGKLQYKQTTGYNGSINRFYEVTCTGRDSVYFTENELADAKDWAKNTSVRSTNW